MTRQDRFRLIQDHLAMLATDVATIKSEGEEDAQVDAHLAGLMVDLLKEFSTTGRIPLSPTMRDMIIQYLEAGRLVNSCEAKIRGIADAMRGR